MIENQRAVSEKSNLPPLLQLSGRWTSYNVRNETLKIGFGIADNPAVLDPDSLAASASARNPSCTTSRLLAISLV
jgi:hypothetical protein